MSDAASLPPAEPTPIVQPTPGTTPPGWYLNPQGQSHWWTGVAWGAPSAPAVAPAAPKPPVRVPRWAAIGVPIAALAIGIIIGNGSHTGDARTISALEEKVEILQDKVDAAPRTPLATDTTAAPSAVATTPPAPAPPAAPSATASQLNAARKAESYLAYAPFSRSGLIEQLEFEGFSTEDATYGADAQGADWASQAAAKAADYLDYSSFSHSGLVDQLVFEGFTPAEAEFGVASVGL